MSITLNLLLYSVIHIQEARLVGSERYRQWLTSPSFTSMDHLIVGSLMFPPTDLLRSGPLVLQQACHSLGIRFCPLGCYGTTTYQRTKPMVILTPGVKKNSACFCSCNDLLEKGKNQYCNGKGLRPQRETLLRDEMLHHNENCESREHYLERDTVNRDGENSPQGRMRKQMEF